MAAVPVMCVQRSEELAGEGPASFPRGVGPLLSWPGFWEWFVLLPFWHCAHHRSIPAANWFFNWFPLDTCGSMVMGLLCTHLLTPAPLCRWVTPLGALKEPSFLLVFLSKKKINITPNLTTQVTVP